MKKKLCILLAWTNFSEYYSYELSEILKDEYDTTITYDLTQDFTQYDVILQFFPKRKIISKNDKIINLFWEPHEFCEIHSKNINAACSLNRFIMIRRYDPKAYYVRLGINVERFAQQPFPEFEHIIVGWAGSSDNPRKRFPELKECMSSISSITFKPNETVMYTGIQTGPIKYTGDMWQYYKTIHIYVSGSAAEGYCLPLLEAASCGRPIICFDYGIAHELKDDGAGIIIVESFDELKQKVESLSQDKQLIQDMGEKSRKAVKLYWNQDRLRDQWKALIKKGE